MQELSLSPRKIYVFLGILTFFEVNLEKPHGDFVYFILKLYITLPFFFSLSLKESGKLGIFRQKNRIYFIREGFGDQQGIVPQ